MKMKTVFQSDEQGCWIACASMLTGVSYDDIKMQHTFRGKVTGRSAKPLVELLSALGVECDEQSTKVTHAGSLRNLDCNALVYFKCLDKEGNERGGHWMVWDYRQQAIRDPEGWQAGTSFRIKNFRKVRNRNVKKQDFRQHLI